jgi:hypothetical protein
MPLRLRAITCEVLARSVYLFASRTPNIVDVSLLRKRLHDTPGTLRGLLQAEIDSASSALPPYDAVVLAYGLCGAATAGLVARDRPVVLPRVHDCITLMLGSRERYEVEFTGHPGTFWFASDYLERSDIDGRGSTGGLVGMGVLTDEADEATYSDYVARYGEDSAAYLMEMTGAWRSHYDRAAFVETSAAGTPALEERVRREAEKQGWAYEHLAGDLVLIRRLLDGDWADDFLVLEPGQRLGMSYDAGIVRAEPVLSSPMASEGVGTPPPARVDRG